MDKLKALATFKAVVDHGGFARAAAQLDVSCSIVTRTVQDLEALLGVRLLHRSTRRVALTPVGEQVLDRAVDLLDGYEQLAAFSSLSASEVAGTVRLSAPASLARPYLSAALAGFVAAHPRVWVDLRLASGPLDRVGEDADLALCLGSQLRSSWIARHLADVPVGLFASPDYLHRHGRPQHPDELASHHCLIGDEGAAETTWRLGQAPARSLTAYPVRGTLRSAQADVLVGAAIHGAGILMQPVPLVQEAVEAGQLQRVLGGWRCEPISLHLAYNSRRNQPLAVRKLIDHLVQAALPQAPVRQAPLPSHLAVLAA